jgi:poly(glycerol-phosphate) alpha-glucosyltransferase
MRHSSGKKKLAAWLYENAHLHGAQCLHALCDAEEAQMREVGFRNPICVIPNGVALPEHDDGGPAPWAGIIPTDADVMLFLGRLHPKKNLPALIEAWSRVSRAGNWHLAIAGWDQLGHQAVLTALTERLGIAQRVHFLGPLFGAEKTRALRRAHAFVLPSLSEGLPMSVLEAWSHGLPVLKTAACNLPEGFRAGAAARLSLDPEGMAHDLERFLRKDRSELRRMGCNGRDLAAEHFSWSAVAQQILDVYAWLAGDRDRPATVRLR